MAILTSSDKSKYFSEVVATSTTLDGLLIIAQAMCESTYGADRPLELQSFTDIVDLYPASGIALIKRSPVIAVSSISVRREVDNFGSSSSEWQLLTSNEYSVDTEINQVNINYSNNWGMLGARRSPMQAKITYTSGFDFSTDTSQEANNIRAICGRIVSYMEQPIAIGKANITDAVGFQAYVTSNSYLGVFLAPLGKYKPRG
jgi:hypothetical protein